jgi:hypothetical protein
MDSSKKLEILEWLASLMPSAVVIDIDENGNVADLSQLNELSQQLDQAIEEVRNEQQQ